MLPKTAATSIKDLAPTLVSGRDMFLHETAQEPENTANSVNEAPWELARAAEYLMNLG